MAVIHATVKAPGQTLAAVADWNAAHTVENNTITAAMTTFADQDVKTTSSPAFAGLTVDTNTLVVDAANDRVGIGTAAPAQKLHVDGGYAFITKNMLNLVDSTGFFIRDTGYNKEWRVEVISGAVAGRQGNLEITELGVGNWLVFRPGGNIGMGISAPTAPLHIVKTLSGSPFYSVIVLQPPAGAVAPDTSVGLESKRLGTTQRWYFGTGSGAGATSNYFRIVDLTAGNRDRFNIVPSSGDIGIGGSMNGAALTGANMVVLGNGNIGMGTITPTISDGTGLHIAGKILRIGTDKTPASAGAAGNKGEICWDADYIYVCVATNTWKRAAISTW